MRALLAIVILAVLGWTGFWFWQAGARERALEGWLAERQAAGWVAEAEDLRVTGFPNRVDAIVTGLDLADPEEGWSWRASELQILALSYKPHHVIAVLPGEQVVATPYETVRATSDLLRGSVIFRPSPRLELDHSTFEIEGMEITGDGGWTAEIGRAILATRQAAGEGAPPFAHDVAFDAQRLRLPQAMMDRVGAGNVLPAEIGKVALDTTLAFDRPWDRAAIEGENPVLNEVVVRDLSLSWGRLDLRGRGTLAVDAEGFAEGRLEFRARNWREMLDVAEAAGVVDPTLAGAVRAGLDLIARLAGDGEAINVPLDFADGRMRLGPIPIGPAPRLVQR
jgi:hypothetical protein